jgi:hypothetical protein
VNGAATSISSYTLTGDVTGLTGITNGTNHDQIGTDAAPIDPLLGTLASNDGLTQTEAPKAGSPALGAAVGLSTIKTDQ